MTLLYCLVLCLPLLGMSLAFQGYTPQTFPDSMSQFLLCKQSLPTLICDPAGQLLDAANSTENYSTLNNLLSKLRYNTTCKCGPADSNLGTCDRLGSWGFTLSIAVVDNIVVGQDEHTREKLMSAVALFADTLRQRLPRGNCDDDAFIVYSVNDRAVWTSVGKVTERYLTPELITTVTVVAEGYFKKSRHVEGLSYMIAAYTRILNGEKIEAVTSKDWFLPKWAVILIGVAVGVVALLVLAGLIYLCARCCCMKDRRGHYSTVNQGRTSHL